MHIDFKKIAVMGALALGGQGVYAATASINTSATHQTIEGFGGGVVYYQSWFTGQDLATREAMYDTAFTGLGLSILRVGNWMQNDSTAKGLSHDVAIYQAMKARRPDARVFMSSWSAPDTLKPSGSVNGNGHDESSSAVALPRTQSTLTKDGNGAFKYASYASWWRRSYQAYADAGILVDYVSMQNEPDMNATYANTLFNPTEDSLAGYDKAFKAVQDTFKAAGIKAKLYGPEPLGIGNGTFQKYADALEAMADPDGYAFHMYDNGEAQSTTAAYQDPETFRSALKKIGSAYASKPLIMSELCHMGQSKPSSYDMIGLARIMQIGFTDGNLSGYINWELLWGDENAVNGQMISVSKPKGWGGLGTFTVNPEYHAMRHFSRFVNAGWKRVESTLADAAELSSVAFKSADGDSLTLVVINASGTNQVPLSGYKTDGYKVSHIVQSVTGGAMSQVLTNSACVTLPPRSITTLVFVSGTETLDQGASCGDVVAQIPSYAGTISGDTLYDALEGGIKGWTASNAKVSVSAATTASQQTVAALRFSGEVQADNGYSNLNFDLGGISKSLSSCKSLSMSAYNPTASGISVNMSIRDGYVSTSSVEPGSGEWVDVVFTFGDSALGGKLSFNSDAAGPLYVANLVAKGCSAGATSSIVIHDFALDGLGTWTADETSAPSLVKTALDGVSAYAYVPLAGCNQADCGYKNVLFSNAKLTNGALYKCQSLSITAHAAGGATSSSVNVGGAGKTYIDYEYGKSVSASEGWKELTVSLAKEADNASTKLKFNSNSDGIYISRITGVGCEGAGMGVKLHAPTLSGRNVAIYHLDGRLAWQGVLDASLLSGHVLKLGVLQPGVYYVHSQGGAFRAIKP